MMAFYPMSAFSKLYNYNTICFSQLVQTMGWKYVGLLYINNNYGIKGANAFQNAARERGFCVAAKVTIPENPTLDDEGDMLDAFSTLVQQQVKVRLTLFLSIVINYEYSNNCGNRNFTLFLMYTLLFKLKTCTIPEQSYLFLFFRKYLSF